MNLCEIAKASQFFGRHFKASVSGRMEFLLQNVWFHIMLYVYLCWVPFIDKRTFPKLFIDDDLVGLI